MCHSFNQNKCKKENSDMRVIVYTNQVDVEELESHFGDSKAWYEHKVRRLLSCQHRRKKITLPQIREFYHTMVKANEEYYNTKVDRQTFHLRSGNIPQLLGVLNDRDKTYFDNVQLEHLVRDFVRQDDLDWSSQKQSS